MDGVVIKLHFDRSLCGECGSCEDVYPGIRRTIEILEETELDFSTWNAIEELATEAFGVCPMDALYGDEDDL